MRVIIQENKELLAKWAARHVAERINNAHPTSEKPFVDVYKRQGQSASVAKGLVGTT